MSESAHLMVEGERRKKNRKGPRGNTTIHRSPLGPKVGHGRDCSLLLLVHSFHFTGRDSMDVQVL